MKDYPGLMEIRNADGTLRDVMCAATKRTKRKPPDRERVSGDTTCRVRYFHNAKDFENHYNSLKAEKGVKK